MPPVTVLVSPDEPQRLAAVRRYDILDTPPDGAFDRITALAARRFNVPIAIVSIVDDDRIWFKSHHGLDVKEIGRDPGLCASAILSNEPWILTDASTDIRAMANPLVAGAFGLRFYAGVPLRTSDGFNLGTLCVIDREPRPIDEQQIEDLKDLASIVMDEMELRLSARQAVARAQMLAREIDHRVMNSLQFVSGMLEMQARSTTAPEVCDQLKIAANRVAAVACVHRHFYLDEPAERVGCLTYLRRLCAEIASILGTTIEVSGIEVLIPTIKIQPIGLIINELVTNAAKHGKGPIKVTFTSSGDGACVLCVLDHGEGLPTGFDPTSNRAGLGMKMVISLCKQLGGELVVSQDLNAPGA